MSKKGSQLPTTPTAVTTHQATPSFRIQQDKDLEHLVFFVRPLTGVMADRTPKEKALIFLARPIRSTEVHTEYYLARFLFGFAFHIFARLTMWAPSA
jgi:hypothetical protein